MKFCPNHLFNAHCWYLNLSTQCKAIYHNLKVHGSNRYKKSLKNFQNTISLGPVVLIATGGSGVKKL